MRHPALDSFSDLDLAAADPHVAGCPTCQEALNAQLQVRALLAALPDPGPAPPDVVDRIEATLRSLAQPAEAASLSAAPAAAATVVPLPTTRNRRQPVHRTPWLAAAAVVIAFAGGGYGLMQVIPGDGHEATQAGAALHERKGLQGGRAVAPSSGVHPMASGTDYRKATLARQVQDVLGRTRVASATPTAAFASPAAVTACLEALGAQSSTPLMIDVATYEGSPAAVVVLPGPDGGREVWVVATTCRPGEDGLKYFTAVR